MFKIQQQKSAAQPQISKYSSALFNKQMSRQHDINVLIIEDNPGDFLLVQEYLSEAFPYAGIVHSEMLADALKVIPQQPVDVVLLDLSLPDSDGYNSIKQLINTAANLPIVVLTGSSDKQIGINSLRLGVQDYLVKDDINGAILQKSISYSIERKKNQHQLEQNEKRFRALIENSTDGLAVLTKEGEITEMSQPAVNILGYPSNTPLGINTKDFVHPDDIKRVVQAFAVIINERNKVQSAQFRIRQPNGNYIWLDTSFHNLLHEPAVNAVVLNFRDITNRKKNEEERKILINELTASNADLKQYTYIASHNLRAPLTNLISIINLLDWQTLTEENAMLLNAFKDSTYQLNETLNDLIEVILIKKSGNLVVKEIQFEQLYHKVYQNLYTLIKESSATIEADFSGAAGVCFDTVYLENIFVNLITNAIKYASPQRPLHLKIYSRDEVDTIQLVFEDNGIGIDMDIAKDKIFGLYQRFHDNPDSKGIGLYLVRSQLTVLGGSIVMESAEDAGTTFTLTFKKLAV